LFNINTANELIKVINNANFAIFKGVLSLNLTYRNLFILPNVKNQMSFFDRFFGGD